MGVGALIGSALAAALFGVLGRRARERDSVIGVVLAFGLGLAVLFIHLYPGRTATSFALLTGQIVGVGYTGLTMLALVCLLVIAVLATCYRPLLFATVDPDVAAARGVPVHALGIVFAALVGVVAAQAVQIVGALLVMSLLITPAAAAARVVDRAGSGDRDLRALRRAGRRGRHRAVAGARRAGVGLRREHLVSDLSGLLAARAAARGFRLAAGAANLLAWVAAGSP